MVSRRERERERERRLRGKKAAEKKKKIEKWTSSSSSFFLSFFLFQFFSILQLPDIGKNPNETRKTKHRKRQIVERAKKKTRSEREALSLSSY